MTLQTEAILRIGQQSVIEFRNPNHLRIFNGSALLLLSKQQSLNLETNGTKIQLTGRGTFMFESPKGKNLKIIMLEGKALLSSAKAKLSLQAGELVLVQQETPTQDKRLKSTYPYCWLPHD